MGVYVNKYVHIYLMAYLSRGDQGVLFALTERDNTLLHNKGQMVGKDRWRQRINGSQRYGSKRSLAIKGSWQQRANERKGSIERAANGQWQQRVDESQRSMAAISQRRSTPIRAISLKCPWFHESCAMCKHH